ncbi:AAA family ATPase [Kineosporia sp. J2-2]|uniref:AAA family ATPase n=1 Tax=Kineosporia corallincola TaxID=2835133 RepID=A0ABS5THM8_9ACTN|nr:AAA family ATPase [Kineosporia corallincola]MBT0769904.1 AAA family ATPase [Kineosporia corallincola]
MAVLKERLSRVRRKSFVGRAAELETFRAALSAPGVLFVHGPGGMGKSTLLEEFAAVARDAGRSVVHMDARHVRLSPDALPAVPAFGRTVLLIDTYERLEPVDDWVREEYLSSLPDDVVVVIAGRRPPGPRWRADPAWRLLTRELPLDNLRPHEGRGYLQAQGVAEEVHEGLLRASHGHPLTLSMLADATNRGLRATSLAELPDVVAALLAQTVESVPSPRHRAALEVCAHAPVTSGDLLRSVAGDETGELFTWLRTLAFVVDGPYGLYPHDAIRDALDADLRWRDPQRYAELDRRLVTARLQQLLATTDERERLQMVVDSIMLGSTRSSEDSCSAPSPTLQAYADHFRESDRTSIVTMTEAWQGPEQAALVEFWLDRRPEAFRVFRAPSGESRGYATVLDLTEADLGLDPKADAMWRIAHEQAPPRTGEKIRAWRFFLDRDQGQQPSPSTTLFTACQVVDALVRKNTAWTLVGACTDPARWSPTMANLDFWPVGEGEAAPEVFGHDWRRRDPTEWLKWVHARHTGGHSPAEDPSQDRVILSRMDFDEAVRAGLRDLHRPEQLAANPLLRSRVVDKNRSQGRTPDQTLTRLYQTAPLPPDLQDLITRTFLNPAPKQQRVAADLHLSFNTFRRRRDQAVARIADWLWEQEIGPRA